MALPQQVVEQLGQGSHRTPGWSLGIIFFSGSILFITILIYAGLRFGYEPYLNGQISSLDTQAQKVGQSVSPADETNLITFYSQITNIRSLIQNHVFFSRFLAWLEANTEVNVHYTNMTGGSNGQVSLTGVAKTSADAVEQIAAFEAAPDVSSVTISGVAFSQTDNGWLFNILLTMQPSLFLWAPAAAPSEAPAAIMATTTVPEVTSSTETPAPPVVEATTTTP